MLPRLVTLDAKLHQALSDTTVAASRARLARELKSSHDRAMVEASRTGWRTADVLPIDALIARRYAELADAGWAGAERVLLSRDSFRVAAERAAPDEGLARHVELFMTAWGLAHEWRLFDHSELQRSENGRAFLDWSRRFGNRCRDNGWITTPELPAALARSAREGTALPRRLTLVGVDRLTPARKDWIDALGASGTDIRDLPLPSARTRAVSRVVRAQTSSEELALVAAWTRETLASNPETTVGIVAPTLNRTLGRFRTQFQAVFDDIDDLDDVVNFGGGGRLTGEPVCRDALRLIEWSLRPLHFEIVAALLRSPFLHPTKEARGPLPAALPTFFDLAGFAKPPNALARLARIAPACQYPSAWGRHFRRLLRQARWHEIDLERRSHEARLQFDTLLLRLGEQDPIVGRCAGTEAFRLLRMIAATRTFTEPSGRAPVQVLSREDSQGLTFDRIWVLGVDEAAWPGPSDPNPLIPTRLQKDAGVPRVTQEDELDWARSATASWLANARETTFSYAETDGDTERRPSPLLPRIASSNAPSVLRDPLLARYRHPYMRRGTVELEQAPDERGTKLESPGAVTGGASVLRDQSICPFRAYAIHRLDIASSRHPHTLPDAIDRGMLAHDALARLLRSHGDSTRLAALSTEDVRDVVTAAVEAHGAGWPEVFREREVERLISLLGEWLQIERRRPGFEVDSVEGSTSIDLGGLVFRLRPDRRDRTSDDQVVILDFKTSPASIMDWRLPRPREPQLPLYATAGPGTNGAAFAQLVPGKARLAGVADDIAGLDRPQRLGVEDFETLKANWHDALLVLASEYRDGVATVEPQRPADCRACHLHSLCRVFEAV